MFLLENVVLWKCSLLVGRGIEIANGGEEFCGCGSDECLPGKQLACECDLFETSPWNLIQASLVSLPELSYPRQQRPNSEVEEPYSESRSKSEDMVFLKYRFIEI